MLKILTVFGTRPEFIKMAPVIKELKKYPQQVSCQVCMSAQHRQMLEPLLKLFDIQPDYDLDIMKDNQTLGHITQSVLGRIDHILSSVNPDYLLVQGDTTTAMSASLAAFYRKIKVGHIEAGLRTWDHLQPYPEEVNRRVIDSLSDIFFAHTQRARENLMKEGVPAEKIEITGNTVIDALFDALGMEYRFQDSALARIPLNGRKIILVTAHRRESFGGAFLNMFQAIREIAEKYRHEIDIIYPVHLNPNVKGPAVKMLNGISNVYLLDPLDYLPFVHLMKQSYLILTDSGGIQEEAPSLGKPVLVMRDVTERQEAVDAGVVKIVGTESRNIVRHTCDLLENKSLYQKMAQGINPYGDGQASRRIVTRILGKS